MKSIPRTFFCLINSHIPAFYHHFPRVILYRLIDDQSIQLNH